MIVASAVMDGISGVDLARALKSIHATRKIPFVLLTSFERDHPELRGLPDDAALVHHDRAIDRELTGAIEAFGWPARC
jgi:CheY-like chemotaxis protein